MKKLFLSFLVLIFIWPLAISRQHIHSRQSVPFEGTIEFIQSNGIDTSCYKYYIKGNNVRIDDLDAETKKLDGSFLIDLTTKKITALSPGRHLYFYPPASLPLKPGGKPKAEQTGKTRRINGYVCRQWLVTDAQEGIKIYYWLAYDHFNFFDAMLKVLNRKNNFSEYYLQIPGTKGMFPILAIEEDMAGNKKGEMKAGRIITTTLNGNLFQIPSGYTEFNK